MRDDRRRNRVQHLRARIVAEKKRGQLVVFDQRDGVAVVAILHRNAQSISEEIGHIRRIARNADRGHDSFRHDERAGRFQLPGRKSIADHGVEREFERLQAVEKLLIDRLEQGEIGFVIDHDHVGRGFLARFRPLQLDIILVRHQVGRDEHAIVREDGAEGALGKRRLLLPRSKVIERLAGYVDPDQRDLLWLGPRLARSPAVS